jgi:Na+/citrate or Na+/malate symporter
MPSTVIADMNYNAGSSILRIRFVSGLIYEYQKVPEKIFRAMQRAGSKGNFLNRYIKGNYDYKKIN